MVGGILTQPIVHIKLMTMNPGLKNSKRKTITVTISQSLLFITNQCASKVRGGDSIVSIVDGPDLNLEKYICDQE